ncbi:MAG TPA: YIP1 family protein [Candidatus Udaeobacter sp.]
MIHVNRGATSLGVFSEEEVREGLGTGRFVPTDIGWREGMASWQPLSRFPELGAAAPTAPPSQTAAGAIPEATAPRDGLPWEHRQERGFFNAFVETLVMVLTKPGEAFTVMKREGGLGEPLIYALIGGCVGGIVSLLYQLGLQSMGFFANRHDTFAAMAGTGVGSAAFIVLVPLFVVIGLFIGSAIVHVCLMIVGGANQPFETTFRVVAFSQGSAGPLQIIPICGGLVAGVWGLVCNCIGLARAHNTDTGRAVLAVFLPIIVCCGGIMLIAFIFGGLGLWSASQH